MNVILISIDSLRFDCVGYQPAKGELASYDLLRHLHTPTLDGIAEKGVCFTNCISTNTYSTASHASIFTGMYPPGHGVRGFYHTRLSPETATLAELFQNSGYEAIMATDLYSLFGPLELDRGFNRVFKRDDTALFEHLNRVADRDIFLFCHFFDVHDPYMYSDMPVGHGYNDDFFKELRSLYKKAGMEMTSTDPYKAWNRLAIGTGHDKDLLFPAYVKGVSKFDKGRFRSFIERLNAVSPIEDSLIVVFSDHGEGTCAQGSNHFNHGGDLFDDVLRVPLVISHPDIPHRVSDNLTSTVDIFPTVLELCDIRLEGKIDGLLMDSGRKSTYSETWVYEGPTYEHEDAEFLLPFRDVNVLLRQRAIRTESGKHIVCGHDEKWLRDILMMLPNRTLVNILKNTPRFLRKLLRYDVESSSRLESLFALDNSAFVNELYKTVLSRFADPDGLRGWVAALESGDGTKYRTLMEFLASSEFMATPKYIFYDLLADPEEKRPINPLADNCLSKKTEAYREEIEDIEMAAFPATLNSQSNRVCYAFSAAPATQEY